jgi:heme iron utilization protein
MSQGKWSIFRSPLSKGEGGNYSFLQAKRQESKEPLESEDVVRMVRRLFSKQKLAVLATQSEAEPYANLVAFASTSDLTTLLFATSRATRKYNNIVSCPNVALLIDDRSNQSSDFGQALAVTVTGSAVETGGTQRESLLGLYLSKHSDLADFVKSENCALFSVTVRKLYVVHQFQNVIELSPEGF